MTLGKKHPWALGKPSQKAWEEIWDVSVPAFRRSSRTAKPPGMKPCSCFWSEAAIGRKPITLFPNSVIPGRWKITGHLCVVTEKLMASSAPPTETLRSLAAELSKTITEEDVVARSADTRIESTGSAVYPHLLLAEDGKQARFLAARVWLRGTPRLQS